MKSLTDRVDEYADGERALSNLLGKPIVLSQIIAATEAYSGYAEMESHAELAEPLPAIDGTLEISESEWAVIRPLFLLYVEKEESLQLEASRTFGVEAFGRQSSEVGQEIELYLSDKMPRLAFSRVIETI